jgi:hypothetical protein
MKRSGDIASLFGNHEAKTMEIPESSSSSNVFIGDETPVPEEEPRQVPTDAVRHYFYRIFTKFVFVYRLYGTRKF